MDSTFVAIVGAGITGLAIGDGLRRAGVPHTILEASDRVGGVIRSGHVDGSLLEWGPQRTRLTAALGEMVERLDLANELVTAPRGLPLFVYAGGRLRKVPFSAAGFLLSDIVPFRSKLRAVVEPFTRGADPDESVAAFFTRKLGRRLYENLAGPLYGGLYASDPADMVVRLSLGRVLEEFGVGRSLVLSLLRRGGGVAPPPACSFAGGLNALPWALHSANSENVRLSTAALSVRRANGRWQIECDGGTLAADRVILTAPAPVAAELIAAEAPALTHSFRSLTYNPLAVVHLRAETNLRGLGYQVSLAERLATRGVTFNDSLFDRKGVYTAYLGGAKAPHVVGWDNDAICATAMREFRQVTGFDARVLSVEREWMPAWDKSWAAIQRIALPSGLELAANWVSRPGIPGRLAQARGIVGRLAAEYGGRGDR